MLVLSVVNAGQTRLDLSGNANASEALPRAEPTPRLLHRQKRFMLLWPGASVSKSVLGVSVPVELSDRVNYRSVNMAYNFQAQYLPIPDVIWPWTRFGIERSLHHYHENHQHDHNEDQEPQQQQRSSTDTIFNDGTRQFAYDTFEGFAQRRTGIDGRQCLLRAICEAAQTPIEHVGLFDEMLQLFLTYVAHRERDPPVSFLFGSMEIIVCGLFVVFFYFDMCRPTDDVREEYVEARRAGLYGVDCLSLFARCPMGSSLLDGISYFKG